MSKAWFFSSLERPVLDSLFPHSKRSDDWIAGAFWKHHPVADQSARTLVDSTLAFHRVTQGRLVKLTPAGNYQVVGRGANADWCGDSLGRRTFLSRAVARPEDWLALDEQLTPLELDMVAAARSLSQALGPQVPLLATVFAPLTQALMLAGPQQLLAHLQSAPERVQAGLQRLTHGTQQLIAAYHAAGVSGIYLAAQHMSEEILGRDLYRLHGRRSDVEVMDACAQLEGNILHIHGASIHFDGVPVDGRWMVHYELGLENPSPESFRAVSRCPAVIGLPLEVWERAEGLEQAIGNALTRFGQQSALLTAPCVVPQAVPDERIASWLRRLEHVC